MSACFVNYSNIRHLNSDCGPHCFFCYLVGLIRELMLIETLGDAYDGLALCTNCLMKNVVSVTH